MIMQQAQIIAYIYDYKLLMIATIAMIPLLIVFKRASDGGENDHGRSGVRQPNCAASPFPGRGPGGGAA